MDTHKISSFKDPNLDRQVVELVKGANAAKKAAEDAQTSLTTHAATATGVHGVGASEVESKAGAQAKADAVQTNLNAHTARTDNPHQVTAAQVGLPPGAIMDFAMPTPPAGWLECDGSAVSRTTYAALFAAIGTTWGAGDGTTTFNLPDFRGEFRRGWDHGRGTDSGREFGSLQLDAVQEMTGSIQVHKAGEGIEVATGVFADSATHSHADSSHGTGTFQSGLTIDFKASNSVRTASETRPRNRAVLTCIKT